MLKKFAFELAFLCALSPMAAQAADLPAYPFIHVGGEGFLILPPDMGEIDFDITGGDADPTAAAALVQARVEEIRALLTEQSGAPDSEQGAGLEVSDLRKELRPPASADAAAEPRYDIRSTLHIVVRDLSKWRTIMLALLEKKDIDHLSTTFGKSDRIQAENELTVIAIKEAQRRADVIAAGFGKKTGAVMAVSTGQLRNLTKAVGLMPSDFNNTSRGGTEAAKADKDFLSIPALRWSQTVDMVFRIR